jgi:hypothetical protein
MNTTKGPQMSAHENTSRWSYLEADEHTMGRFPRRPPCCGVLLDWKPA